MSASALPRVLFVLGKGGVGRSTVAAALGAALAARGRRTCVFGWAADDPIGPWFGAPASALAPQEIAPGLHAANYRLDDTLELYFAGHLKMPRFYRHVIRSVHVREMIEAAPGLAEVFFVGHIWWLTTLAREEAGLRFDHVVVDAPATGHGVSLFDVPSVLASMPASGLLALETRRVSTMLSDPRQTGSVVVTLAEELAVEETIQLLARLRARGGRSPLGVLVNRSVAHLAASLSDRAWLPRLREQTSRETGEVIDLVVERLAARLRYEAAARAMFAADGVVSLAEELTCVGPHTPRAVVGAVTRELDAWIEGAR